MAVVVQLLVLDSESQMWAAAPLAVVFVVLVPLSK